MTPETNSFKQMQTVEKGDTVAIRSGGVETSVEVVSVRPDYERPGHFLRFDYINHAEASPMRRTAWPSDMIRVVRKNQRPAPDPKETRAYDLKDSKGEIVIDGKAYLPHHTAVAGCVIIDGKVFIPKGHVTASPSPEAIINPAAAAAQVHTAVAKPARPVQARIKTDRDGKK